ncbi:glycoside hydrolase family 92 protein, partial [bacterium]
YLYTVTLEGELAKSDDIDVRFAPGYQAGIYRFEYPNDAARSFSFNSGDGEIKVEGATISAIQNLGNRTKAYVYIVFSETPQSSGTFNNGAPNVQTPQPPVVTTSGGGASVYVAFSKSRAPITARYGVSFISVEQAKKNLEKEIPNFDFNAVEKKGRAAWNTALGKLEVQGGTSDQKTVFYTSLYRTYERMINISEDGKYYSATDHQVHDDGGVPYYTDDWIWDTYRAAHPLHILINPKLENAKIASYVRMAQQSREGWMPTFPEVTGDSHRMNGNHAVAVVWDAYCKGLRGFSLEEAYDVSRKAIMESTMSPWMRRPAGEIDAFYKEKGYFPGLRPDEKETDPVVHGFEKRQSVAVTLAASFDDWCLSQIARQLGKMDDYRYFLARSYNYRNLYNNETAFFHPKDKEGNFIQPFDYRFSGGIGVREYYDENNGWTYRWDVQHNVADLVNLMGGREKFVANLDQTYAESMGRGKREFYQDLPDQTGNVGQFTMGNEPSLHIPYLYNYGGAPWKTQKRVRSLLDMWFRNDLMGIPGDEDGGGLTSFVVFSSMGFYPVTVGSPAYNIGSPVFTRVAVDLDNGKKFIIEAKGASDENKYIQSAKLNGVVWDKPWFAHSDIAQGGKLELVMGSRPNKAWGSAPGAVPPSAEPKP